MHSAELSPIVLLLLAVSSCTTGGPSLPAQSNSVVVPIRLEEVDPLVTVRVNGLPIDVLFDTGTGASLALFPPKLNEVAGRTLVDTSKGGPAMGGPTGGGRPIYRVDLVQIGDFGVSNARVAEDFHDEDFQERFSSRLEAHGFLGIGYFEDQKVVIDYQRRRLTIIPPDAPADQQAACGGAELQLVEGTGWGLVSRAATDVGEIVLVWDTGAPFNALFKQRTDADQLQYSQGDSLSLEQLIISGQDFGPVTFEILDWGDNGPPFDGFIGHHFFLSHVVCIDFPENRIFVR